MYEKLNFQILGKTAQVLEVNLEPDKTIIADGGALLYLDEEIQFVLRDDDAHTEVHEELEEEEAEPEPDLGDFEPEITWQKPHNSAFDHVFAEPPSKDEDEEKNAGLLEKLWSATKKTIGKYTKFGEKKEAEPEEEPANDFFSDFKNKPAPEESEPTPKVEKAGKTFSWYLTHFTNESDYIRKVAFTTATAGSIVSIDLTETFENEVIIQTGTFLCARKGTILETFADTGVSVNFLKEKFFKLDRLSGKDFIFLKAEGDVIEKELENDAIRVNLFSLVAFESSLDLDTKNLKYVQSMNYEDDAMFATLQGTGRYWVQTANIQHLVYRISPFIFEPSDSFEPATPVVEKPNSKSASESDLDLLAGLDE
ncbi:MAG: AIM24 family protein [Microscillaceae bacterium]|jgi:uncharacterized protein (AIM24 family)|nr:AIM24 family protein [Microscillaceae bacterium]